jgi:hypothetical protein
MRRLFTARESGLTWDALRWGERAGRWRRVQRGIYAEGAEAISELDRQRARVLASASAARGALAGVLHDLDGIELDDHPTRRGALAPDRVVTIDGIPCAGALQTLIDLAAVVDDDAWEQALECALRKKLVTVAELDALPKYAHGGPRIRRVLAARPEGAPPTESLLETLALQLARTVPGLGDPTRQYVVRWEDGRFVARVDLCWPELGLFLELDGQHHKDQPVYDARRQTAVVAATGWLCGRFTWREIVHTPRATARALAALVEHARRNCAA